MPTFGLAFGLLAAITAVRLIGLHYSVVDLFYDESQYWSWSREFAFGYFSKPPLLAWIIAVSDRVCGDSEACVRAPAPILYFGMSLFVYGIARQLYDARVAFFSAISIGLAIGVVFSARIISTDVPLLFCWALALLCYVKLLDGGDWRWAATLGVSLGLGMLAKYAMAYFLLGVALAACLDRDARRLLRAPALWFALAVAAAVIAPNVVWNAEHSFGTVRELGSNATGDGIKFSIGHGLEFIGSQFGVFGPILFSVLLLAIARIASPAINRADRLMLAFAIPPLALIAAIGFVTKANGNWAATSFISGAIVAVALLVREKAWKWLTASIAIGVVAQIALLVFDTVATKVHLPVGGDLYHATLGWRAFATQSGQLARRIGARSIVGDVHFEIASLLYYWRDQPEQILSWAEYPTPDNNFDVTRPFSAAAPQPILYVTACLNVMPLSDYFGSVEPLGEIIAPSGPTTTRYFRVYKLSGPRGPIPPRGHCYW